MNTHIDEGTTRTRKRRRSSGEIDAILRDMERSGQSQAEFAALQGVSLATLRQWIYRRRAKAGSVDQDPSSFGGFVPVRLKSVADDSASVTVRFPSGHEVVLPGSFGLSALQGLVSTLIKSC